MRDLLIVVGSGFLVGVLAYAVQWYRVPGRSRIVFTPDHVSARDWQRVTTDAQERRVLHAITTPRPLSDLHEAGTPRKAS